MHKVKPMLAKSAALPKKQEEYAYEVKWDGIRALIYIHSPEISIISRNLLDITPQYPELAKFAQEPPGYQMVLDGEIVAFNEQGQPSFSLLQHRMGLTSRHSIAQKIQQIPVTYIIFDLLELDGRSLLNFTYVERRRQLEQLNLNNAFWQTPAYKTGDGNDLLTATRALGLEGVVAKKLNSSYEPGRRTGNWLKIKNQKRQELVIGGWSYGQGRRTGQIGALIVGYYNQTAEQAANGHTEQHLQYAGRVGTGFTQALLKKLAELLQPLRCTTNPFSEVLPDKDIIFVEPCLVGEFEFTEWTPNHTLRHPVFKGLRQDKHPRDVIRET